ncbi:MAG TPA: IS607 family transposase [Ktedonobacteraceae bacterium]|jgi:predicted site-specific integrase-resolvase|nr:IS607 family transposase [Ktedonobacteraceae bacterium]
MKLSEYAKKYGITYRTAFRWWQNGQIKGFQKPSGTIIVTEGEDEAPVAKKAVSPVVIYARVSSPKQQDDLDRQVKRLEDYCAARGYQVGRIVKEIGSGVNDSRRKFLALLTDPKADTIVVEHKDRATRFGFRYLEILLTQAGRTIEVANLAESDHEDLLQDLTSIVSSMCARLYDQRRARRKAEKIVQELEAPNASS